MLWLEPEILQWFTPQVMPKYEDLYYIRPSSLAPNYLGLKDLMDGDYVSFQHCLTGIWARTNRLCHHSICRPS